MIKLNLILSYVIDKYNKSKETNMLFGPYMKMLSHAYKFESKGQRSQPIKAFQDQKLFIPLELFFALYGLESSDGATNSTTYGQIFFFPKYFAGTNLYYSQEKYFLYTLLGRSPLLIPFWFHPCLKEFTCVQGFISVIPGGPLDLMDHKSSELLGH